MARADLKGLQAKVSVSEQGVRVARSDQLPTVSASANFGTNYSNASADVANAELAVNDLQRQIAVDVRRTVLDRKSAEASLAAAQARVAASGQAAEVTEKRYQAGVATLFEVTQSRADLVDAKSAVR